MFLSYQYIANPIANGGRTDQGRRAMILLKDKVLKSILLRRTKKGRAADLALPPRIVSFDVKLLNEENYVYAFVNYCTLVFIIRRFH